MPFSTMPNRSQDVPACRSLGAAHKLESVGWKLLIAGLSLATTAAIAFQASRLWH